MHPSDHDLICATFLCLRKYTFKIDPIKIKEYLISYKRINPRAITQIVNHAKKISQGITPRKNTRGPLLRQDIIDLWLEKVEGNL